MIKFSSNHGNYLELTPAKDFFQGGVFLSLISHSLIACTQNGQLLLLLYTLTLD